MSTRDWRHGLAWLGLVTALLGVFALYARPGFLVQLADQLWACF